MGNHEVSGLGLNVDGGYGVITHSDIIRLVRQVLCAEHPAPDNLESEVKTLMAHPLSMRMLELLNDIGI